MAEEIDGISYDVTTYTCEDCGLTFVQYQIDYWDYNGDGAFEVVCKMQSM